MTTEETALSVLILRGAGYEDAADHLEGVRASMRAIPDYETLRSGVHVAWPEDPRLYGKGPVEAHAEDLAKVQALAEEVKEGVTLPDHYSRHTLEPIRFIVENMGPSFLIGNAVKYLMRYDAKDGHKDLAKAARYVEMLRRYEAGDDAWWDASPSGDLPKDPTFLLRTAGNR